MYLRRILCATLTATSLLMDGQTLAAPQPYNFRGGGSVSCGDAVHFIASRETNVESKVQATYMAEWVWGYVAAYNGRGAFDSSQLPREVSSIEPPDEQTVYLFIDTFCHAHPTAMVIEAAQGLLRSLGGKTYIPPKRD
jgi:hypothetical protein